MDGPLRREGVHECTCFECLGGQGMKKIIEEWRRTKKKRREGCRTKDEGRLTANKTKVALFLLLLPLSLSTTKMNYKSTIEVQTLFEISQLLLDFHAQNEHFRDTLDLIQRRVEVEYISRPLRFEGISKKRLDDLDGLEEFSSSSTIYDLEMTRTYQLP